MIDKLNTISKFILMQHKNTLRHLNHPVKQTFKVEKSSLPNDITGMFYILFPEGMRASMLLLCQHTRVDAVRAAYIHIYRRLESVRAAGWVKIWFEGHRFYKKTFAILTVRLQTRCYCWGYFYKRIK